MNVAEAPTSLSPEGRRHFKHWLNSPHKTTLVNLNSLFREVIVLSSFLAVQDSSIGDVVSQLVSE